MYSQGVPINESYCGEAEQNGPLVGSIAIESAPILTFAQTALTSVAAAAVNAHTVIYLGTQHGHLKQVCRRFMSHGCGLGLDVSVLRSSQDVLTSRLGLRTVRDGSRLGLGAMHLGFRMYRIWLLSVVA